MSECKDITPEQLKTTNGCGSSYWLAWIFRIPKWISKKLYCCCGCHDIQYQEMRDKEVSDLELRACVRHSALNGPWWQKWIKWKTGDLMFWALNTKLSMECFYRNQ